MISYIKKDITTVDHGLVAHGTNCKGAFGRGIAYAIKKKWPIVYSQFMTKGKSKSFLGTFDYVLIKDDLVVGNAYTQLSYGSDGKVYADTKAIRSSLCQAAKIADIFLLEMYIPRIGCGLGGLNWDNDVLPIIEDINKTFTTVDIYICDL